VEPAGDVSRGPADAEGVSLFFGQHLLEAGVTAEPGGDVGWSPRPPSNSDSPSPRLSMVVWTTIVARSGILVCCDRL
jgi:hypothetical protein